MELELGLKITKTKDDIASISEYQLANAGPVFQSRETNTKFILTAHLKGYKRNNIDIKISKDGSKISISGEKPIQEMVMMGWVMHRKMVDVTGFNKVFRIPDGVNLDRIKAKYDEEEWILNIIMPKLVKGICGARIEEVKEEEFDKGRSELEKIETDDVSGGSVGETSQKGSKEYEVQGMEGSESIMEKKEGAKADKMYGDANKEINIETVQKEVGESKLGIEDGNEESVREKVGKEEYEVMKTPELEQNAGVYISQKIEDTSQDKEYEEVQKMDSRSVEKKEGGVSDKMLDDANGEITGGTIKKDKEESKLRTEDGKVKGMGEKVGKETHEAMKTSEIEQDVGAGIPQKIGDASRDKGSEVQEMKEKGSVVEKEKMVSDSILDVSNRDIIGEMIHKEKSNLGIEEGDEENVMKKVGKEGGKAMRSSELEQNVVDHIPSNIGGTSQKDFNSRIQQMEKTKSTEGKMDGGESEKTPVEANKDIPKTIFGDTIQKDIIKPKIETEDGDQECVREKPDKEGFDAMITTREEFPKNLPKTTLEESEGLNVPKMQETKNVKEEMVKRKGKEIEYFVEKGEDKTPKRIHVEARKGTTRETMQQEIEKSENASKESGQQHVRENTAKERYEVSKSTTEELPKQVAELDGSKGIKVAKDEEQKEVSKEAMAETESLMEKVEGEESKKRTEEASRVIEKSTVTEILHKKIEDSDIERNARDRPHVGEFEVLGTVQEKLPKQVVEAVAQNEKDKIEYGIVKMKGEGSTKMHVEPNETFEEETTGDRIEKEIRKQKLESSDQLSGNENVDKGIFDGRKRQKFPEMEKTEDVKEEGAKIEEFVKKVNGDKDEKIQVEANERFRKDITRETTGKEIEDPKTQTKEKDERRLQEEMSKGRFQARQAAKEEFPTKMVDSPANTREGLQDTKMEKTEGIKEEGAEIEQFVKKVKGEKYKKLQLEANEGWRNDITQETARKETEEDPKILIKVKDQQCLQEEMSKGRHEASTTSREFPMQIVDSLAKTREGPKDKEIEEAEEVKGEVAKRKSGETKVVESTTKEKIEGSESERSTQILQEVPEEKHPKALEIGTPERELQSAKGPTTCAEVVSMRFKEVEQGSAKDRKQKTKLLPPESQSKETHESKVESMNQDILKPKKTEEVGEQCTYSTARAKEDATMEDKVVKPLSAPRFPSTQQYAVEEKDKLYERSKAKYEASLEPQKEDPTKDMQNLIEMKENQEAKQKETLKPEIPLEKHLKKGGQVIRKGEFHKGQKVGETMQEKTKGPKDNIDDRDQQYVARGVGKAVGKVETTEKGMSKEYVADAGPIAERMETKRGLKTTPEIEEYISTQNVNDEKSKIQDEIIKADIEKVDKAKCILETMKTTQEKEHPMKSEVVGKEAESLDAIPSLPSVTGMGVKEAQPNNEIAEPHQKELSPLTAEMKSKEPLELEKPVMQWKFPKAKEHVPVPELRDGKQHDYGTEGIKLPKIAAYQGAKSSKLQRPTIIQQSIDEENRKSENVVEAQEATKESPKMNIVGTEEIDSLQPQVLENQRFEEQKFDGQKEALDQCGFQGSKILIEDRDQQHVKENNDKKGYQTPKDVEEELLKREQKAEIVMKKREGPEDIKSEEVKDAFRIKRERGKGKETQTAEERKPKTKEITPQFEKASGFKQVAEKMHETQEREHQRESEEVTSKMGVEPPATIEKTPNKGVERPTMDYEIPKIGEVQQENEGERHIHAPEATISKEKGRAQASATPSKAKGNVEQKGEIEIDKPQVNQLPTPSIEMLSKEPHELDEFSVKGDDSKAENLVKESERKESMHSIGGITASEVVADKGAQPSKLSSSSCTQQFEVEGEDNKTDSSPNQESQEAKKKGSKLDVQESTKNEKGQEVQQTETLQPESHADQQCINKDEEERHGIDEIILLEDQKESKEEASGGKKDDKKMSKKLFVPLVIAAGSAFLVSLIVIFVRNRRAKKRY